MSDSHDGLSSDSAEPVRLVALSRLLATREDLVLGAALQTPTGQAVAAAVQALVLRVAAASGVAAAALDAGNVQSLFNLSASHVAQQRLYDGGLMLPSRLPHANAKRLLAALLDALTAERATVVGHRVAQRLLQVPAPAYDAEAAAEVAALMAAVEQAGRLRWRPGWEATVAAVVVAAAVVEAAAAEVLAAAAAARRQTRRPRRQGRWR